jgi:O-acetylserine/cysteine efflux transporter
VLLIGVNLIWGASYVIARHALEATPPYLLAFLRMSLAALVMAPLVSRERVAPIHRGSLARIGALGFGLSYWLIYAGMARTTVTAAALLVNMEAAATAVLGWLLLGERVGARGWAGIAVASAGAALILAADQGAPGGAGRLIGNLLVISATLCEAAATVLSRPLRAHLSGRAIAGLGARWGALFLALPALLQWARGNNSTAWLTTVNAAEIAYLALGSTVVAYSIWYGVLHRVPAGSAAAFLCLQPVVALLLAAAFRGERLLPAQAGGGALVLLGLLLVSTAGRREEESTGAVRQS